MYKSFVKKHVVSLSILLFVSAFLVVQHIAPSFLYKKNGHIRRFGIGYKEKTVLPIWLIALIMAILSYIAIRYFSEMSKRNF